MIKKAIIPIAGLGSRFLPITKSVGKEMLNIIDKPVVHYILEECIDSGINEVVFVISENQDLVQDYFNLKSKYCKKIYSSGNKEKIRKLDNLKNLLDCVKINFVIQKNPKGDGDAIMQARESFKEGENFAILFGDDLIQNKKTPGVSQLIKKFSKTGGNIIGVQEIKGNEVENYGIIDKNSPIKQIQEKPKLKDAISNLGIIGKYICNYEIFDAIQNGNKSNDGEIRLSNGFDEIIKNGNSKIFGQIVEGKRYDTGSKNGFIKATIGFGIERGIIKKEEVLKILNNF